MPQQVCDLALLLADITGSTVLYEKFGDAAAVREIGDCLDRLKAIAKREGGTFVRSRGDDILCAFPDPASAFKAARQMLSQPSRGSLAIHAGAHFGSATRAHGDLFGDAVNLTARLAALAKPGEVLVSREFVVQLPDWATRSFRVLDRIAFKGKNELTEVYALLEDDRAPPTEIVSGHDLEHYRMLPEVLVALRYREDTWRCGDRAALSIGRSPNCDLVIGQPWVSRQHAILTVRGGKVQLEDRSSLGTYVTMPDGQELFMHREMALLSASGIISPSLPPRDNGAEVIHYEVVRARPDRSWRV